MPNPQGSDQEEEWLELQNLSSEPVKLGGWECKTQSGHRYLFPEYTSIAARGYLMLPRSETHLPLRNEGDTLMLTASSRATADTVTYGPAIEGQSYSRMNSGEWNWTARVTPGTPNMFSAGDSAPSASPRSLVLQDSLSLDDRSPSETPSSNAQTYSPIPVLPASAVSKARGIPFWMPIAILAAVFAYAGIWIRRKISGSHPKNI